MSFQDHVKKELAHLGHGSRTAAWPPFSKHGPPEPPQGGSSKRSIPKDHPFDPKSLKPMAKTLWACSVSLGHALTAYRHFTRLKSATVSPDGRLGGRGYVMGMAEVRQRLYDVCEALSAVSDTLFDEINAPHWKPKLAMLDEGDQEDVSRFVEESQEYLENPEEEAEEEMRAVERGEGGKSPKVDSESPDKEPSSELPTSVGVEEAATGPGKTQKEASIRWASTLPVDTLPGPRLDGWDRADYDGPLGSVNPPEDMTSDLWGVGGPREYDYLGEYENYPAHQASQLWAESVMPSDDTPTEAWDFGLGFGASGQGAGGYANPSNEGNGKGVWGPQSGLPGTPPASSGDMTPQIDVNINERRSVGLLPGDNTDPVARRDEYPGPKGNLVNQLAQAWGESLPGAESVPVALDIPVDIDQGFVQEDINTPWLPQGSPGMVLPEGTPGTRVV